MYLYLKALHLIFIVTWFSGMFYVVRLFIYNTEGGERPEQEKEVLQKQFTLMIRRLWLGITWPSAILTLIFGFWLLYLYGRPQSWLWIKIGLVTGLYLYHLSLHHIYRLQNQGIFRYSSMQLRIWNEVATVFLVVIVLLAVVKNSLNWMGVLIGTSMLALVLFSAIRIYRILRKE